MRLCGKPLLGLLELLPAWVDLFGRPLSSAFDPCTNVAVGSAMLSQFDSECAAQGIAKAPAKRSAPSPARRRCVLRKYEEAIGLPDFATITTLELRYQRPTRPSVTDAPIFAPASSRSWGPDQLLVPMGISLP